MEMVDCRASSTLTGLLTNTTTVEEIVPLQVELGFNQVWHAIAATFSGESTGDNPSWIPIDVVITDWYLGSTQYPHLSHDVTKYMVDQPAEIESLSTPILTQLERPAAKNKWALQKSFGGQVIPLIPASMQMHYDNRTIAGYYIALDKQQQLLYKGSSRDKVCYC